MQLIDRVLAELHAGRLERERKRLALARKMLAEIRRPPSADGNGGTVPAKP